ncbi:MAG: hypothetical protein ACM3NQ_25710 [Bacteroidales bacterium]
MTDISRSGFFLLRITLTVFTLLVCGACVRPKLVSTGDCGWYYLEYQPSQWEVEWRQGETSGDRRDRECELLATPVEVDRSVRLITAIQDAMLRNKVVPPDSIALFSRMVYARRCGSDLKDTGKRRVQLIEPLVGLIRDPLTICPRPQGVTDDLFGAFGPDESPLQSKRHLLVGNAAPWTDTPDVPASWRIGGFEPWANAASALHAPRTRQNVLLDIGASTYGNWKGDPGSVGAMWFVQRFKNQNLNFDWIVSYENTKYDPDDIYRDVPNDVLPHYIYFNQGVEADPLGKWNPWRILRGMGATPADYVVVKLDIDVPDIENPLVDQVLNDPGLQGLIDEMFYEHHTNTKPMLNYWDTKDSPLRLADTYRIFAAMRSKGIRMHGWP